MAAFNPTAGDCQPCSEVFVSAEIAQPIQQSESDQRLVDAIDRDRLPRHIAIIMDGNGRWARGRNYSRIKGHKAGIAAVQDVVKASIDLAIPCLTLYAFSTENWKRPANETGTLMALLRQYLRLEFKTVHEYDVKLNVIGAVEELAPGIQRDLKRVIDATANHTGMQFNLALNYSGRSDIIHAIQKAAKAGADLKTISEDQFADYLSTAGQPDPDLVIRTSGEFRVSNFLLWQIAYSEIWVTRTYWPDFRRRDLYTAILDYQARNRRFGGI